MNLKHVRALCIGRKTEEEARSFWNVDHHISGSYRGEYDRNASRGGNNIKVLTCNIQKRIWMLPFFISKSGSAQNQTFIV